MDTCLTLCFKSLTEFNDALHVDLSSLVCSDMASVCAGCGQQWYAAMMAIASTLSKPVVVSSACASSSSADSAWLGSDAAEPDSDESDAHAPKS